MTNTPDDLEKGIVEARQVEDFWYRMIEAVGQPLVATDPEGNITYCNPAAAALFGWSVEDITGQQVTRLLVDEAERPEAEDIVARLNNGQAWAGEFIVKRRDGSTLPVLIASAPICDAGSGVVGLVGSATDMTRHKQTEAALRDSEQRFRTVFEGGPVGMALVNQDFRLTRANAALCALLGYSEAELVRLAFPEITHPDDLDADMQYARKLLKGEIPNYHIEKRFVARNGDTIWVDLTMTLFRGKEEIFGLKIIQDIRQRKRAEAENRRHSERMEALANLSNALSEARLDFQRVLETVVRGTSELTGDLCVLSLVNENTHDLDPTAFYHSDPTVVAMMEQLLPGALDNYKSELDRILRLGQPIFMPQTSSDYIRQRVSPRFWQLLDRVNIQSVLLVPMLLKGILIGSLGAVRTGAGHPYTKEDLWLLQNVAGRAASSISNARLYDEIRAAHEQMRDLARQAVTVQEEERKRVSRELHDEAGQALTALKISLQMIRDEPVPEAVRQRLEQVIELADQTMEHIRLISHDLRPPVLDALGLNLTLQHCCRDFTERTRITADYQGTSGEFMPDTIEVYLYRFLQEALTNVAKHAHASQVQVRLSRQENLVSLVVSDDGCGFDPLPVISEKHASKGIGLLGIRERLALLGGWLDIKSSAGQGTVLTASIPWEGSP